MRTNRIILAGGRDFNNWGLFKMKVSAYILLLDSEDTEIVSGDATGADALAENYAAEYHYSFKKFRADWDRFGKSAGPIRNREMAAYSTHLIDFWDGKSPGSRNMIEEAKAAGLKVRVVHY